MSKHFEHCNVHYTPQATALNRPYTSASFRPLPTFKQMAEPSLEKVPNELFDWILQSIAIDDICNLRLASRTLNARATQETFFSHFRSIRLHVKKHTLESFAAMTQGPLGQIIEGITIVGFVYDYEGLENILESGERWEEPEGDGTGTPRIREYTDDELDRIEEDLATLQRQQAECQDMYDNGYSIALLRQAFTNIARHAQHKFRGLTLEVAVHHESTTDYVIPRDADHTAIRLFLEMASNVFSLVSSAISDTQLSLDQLVVFGNVPASMICGVPCETLSKYQWTAPAYAQFTTNLKSLTLKFSDRVLDRRNMDDEAMKIVLAEDANSSGLRDLLASLINLEELHVSRYALFAGERLSYDESEDHDPLHGSHRAVQRRQVHAILQARMARLRTLKLGGMNLDVSDLEAFLRAHRDSLRTISFDNIGLRDGPVIPLLELLASEIPGLLDISMQDMDDDDDNEMRFEGEPEQSCTRISGAKQGRNAIHRWGEDAKKVITFYRWGGPIGSSYDVIQARTHRAHQYGGGRRIH
ncbi:uncharacterized protein K489DRAFT_251552 [Dissoconium aciculare CBS 342.82]|uniref:F-box domain-containing protein n=1 Tax=Dissoconium aciculare CBS 342.82 TaxID=1314786 RepID=A0A6J3M3U6_9PEZI|nr:uncharacterized protein K489DRAFT_251552 [Dissoconium aciculare CBS 342.82]KAF1821592.1 hypothetical protein K489DRAFT_251552 [Dissoconium aciculare CBS 342.82]